MVRSLSIYGHCVFLGLNCLVRPNLRHIFFLTNLIRVEHVYWCGETVYLCVLIIGKLHKCVYINCILKWFEVPCVTEMLCIVVNCIESWLSIRSYLVSDVFFLWRDIVLILIINLTFYYVRQANNETCQQCFVRMCMCTNRDIMIVHLLLWFWVNMVVFSV